jgi:hypothetical protein
MAAKKKSKTPAHRYLRYELTNSGTPGTETSHFIDLARDLSRINRRLYRQGRDYHVKRISVVSSNTIAATNVYDQTAFPGATTQTQNAGRITVSTALDTWVTRNAWRRGFELYQKMNKMAMSGSTTDLKGTYADFKVYLHSDMRTGTVLDPLDNGGNPYQAGDWDYSEFVSPDGTTSADSFEITLHGNHVGAAGTRTSVGLIRSYGEARATVQNTSPNVPATADDDPLNNLFDDGTHVDEIIEDLIAQNDGAPYANLSYPGDDSNGSKPVVIQQTTLGADGRTTVGGFNAICGLLELETTSPIANDVYSVLVELAPGSYRGIAAEVI